MVTLRVQRQAGKCRLLQCLGTIVAIALTAGCTGSSAPTTRGGGREAASLRTLIVGGTALADRSWALAAGTVQTVTVTEGGEFVAVGYTTAPTAESVARPPDSTLILNTRTGARSVVPGPDPAGIENLPVASGQRLLIRTLVEQPRTSCAGSSEAGCYSWSLRLLDPRSLRSTFVAAGARPGAAVENDNPIPVGRAGWFAWWETRGPKHLLQVMRPDQTRPTTLLQAASEPGFELFIDGGFVYYQDGASYFRAGVDHAARVRLPPVRRDFGVVNGRRYSGAPIGSDMMLRSSNVNDPGSARFQTLLRSMGVYRIFEWQGGSLLAVDDVEGLQLCLRARCASSLTNIPDTDPAAREATNGIELVYATRPIDGPVARLHVLSAI